MKRLTCFLTSFVVLALSACEDFVKIDAPRTSLTSVTVYSDDKTANAALLGIYYQMQSVGFASGGLSSISLFASFLADEQDIYYTGTPVSVAEYRQFYENELLPDNGQILRLWSDMYNVIYRSNAVIEGIQQSTGISSEARDQFVGEAKFIRAFTHFYLAALWGDVPLILTTDYKTNARAARTPADVVLSTIANDLTEAMQLLKDGYAFAGNERVRVGRGAAIALLARVYLFQRRWDLAEEHASTLINNTAVYKLTTVGTTFNVNSDEAILQWWSTIRPNDRGTFYFAATPTRGALRPALVNAFQGGDVRATAWRSSTPAGLFRTTKYVSAIDNPPIQYSTVLRLAEQYLIRAEARAQQGNFIGAQQDINTIRQRASLAPITPNDLNSLLMAIEQERRVELFNEWGHRWMDLVRTGRANAVLMPVKPQWQPEDVLLPIPESELRNNPAITNNQNPGY